MRSRRSRRVSAASRTPVAPERLEGRVLFSVPEPNNTFDQAFSTPDNVYLEQNFNNSDSVSSSTDPDDYYKFYTLYGPSHLYAVLNGLSADADLYVYDQDHNQIAASTAGGNVSETVNVDLAPNRYFYVRVRGYSGSTNYGLSLYNDYAGSTLGTARDVGTAWGQSNSNYWAYNHVFYGDYMDFRDNTDVYKFRMEAPGTVSLRRLPTQDPGGGALVTNLQLLDENGNVLANGTGGDGGLNLDRFSLNTGTYYVRLQQSAGSGQYSLRIVSDYAGDTVATARNLGDVTNSSRQEYDMVGNPTTGVTYADALDLYRIQLTRATPLDLHLTIAQGLTPPTFDADLYLARDTNGNGFIDAGEILNQSSNPGDESLHYNSQAAGTYYVGVKQFGAYTSYQLDIDSDVDVPVGSATPFKDMSRAQDLGAVSGNQSFEGGFGISAGDFTDFYKFTLPVAGKVRAGAFTNPFYSRETQNPYVSIVRDANGNNLNDNGEQIASAQGNLTLDLAPGTYYMSLAGTGQQAAYYGQFTVDYAPDTLATARAMAPVTGSNPATQTFDDYIEQDFGSNNDVDDFYKFTLPAAYNVVLRTTGVEGEDLSLALIRDANGNGAIDAGDVIGSSDGQDTPNETINRPSLGAGTYFVRVHGVNGGTNYTLSANFVPAVQAAPRVARVYVSGSDWSANFMNYLQARGLGSSSYGYLIGAGAAQTDELPWNDIDQVSIAFDRNVSAKQADLAVRGTNGGSYPVVAYSYDASSNTGTWTLGRTLAPNTSSGDKVLLDLNGDAGGVTGGGQALDGEFATGATLPSGNGTAGGDFRYRINVLPGDVNRDGRVNAVDIAAVRNRQLATTNTAGNVYTAMHDVNGSGNINAVDLGSVRARQLTTLPGPEPTAATGLSAPAVRKELFGERAILA